MTANEQDLNNAITDMVNRYNKVIDILTARLRKETTDYYNAKSELEREEHFNKMIVCADLYSEIINKTLGV